MPKTKTRADGLVERCRVINGKKRHFYGKTLKEVQAKIAAVLIDGEATLKRVFLFDDHIELRAENPAFATIIRIGEAMNTVTIEGKAVGLCRKL